MKRPRVIIKHQRKRQGQDGYEEVRDLEDFYNLKVIQGAKNKKDTFNFGVVNHRENVDGIPTYLESRDFNKQDIITVYAYYEDEYTGSLQDHFLIGGFIEQVDYTTNETLSSFAIKGTNTTDMLMNVLVPATYTGSGNDKSVEGMVIDLVQKANATVRRKDYPADQQQVRQINAELAIGGMVDGRWVRTDGGYVWPNKTDGSAFPVISYVKQYSNMYTHLKTLVGTKYTEDENGTYMFYVDADDNLHYEPKVLVVDSIADEYLDPNASIKKASTTDGMVNVLVYNCGGDPSGNGILVLAYSMESVKKFGAKWKYITNDKVSSEKKKAETSRGPSYNPGESITTDNYPSAYPWTVSQSGSFYDKVYEPGDTVADADAYREYVRTIVKTQGKREAQQIVDIFGLPRDQIVWEPELGTNAIFVNTVWDVNLHSIEYTNKIRIIELQHDFTNDWKTTITLQEDEEDIVKKLQELDDG